MDKSKLKIAKVKRGIALVMALALAGCASDLAPSKSTANDAPAGAGLNIPPGSNEDFIVNVGRRVFFTENSAALDDTAKTTLDNQAAWLSTYPAYKVKVEGFADEKGSTQFNMQLGAKRAEAVVSYLVSKGIPAARLKAKSFGNASDRKVKACDDISCWSQNRRAVTVLVTDVET
ncbi:MAG: OmpA family protein [Hyphomicrobiales bacterium]|nr:OmpA family protein [Hyphomicrobiales bacterium]MBV8426069.1 OmpA family protein [Hyphomicrobiales bacterium]MBV9432977.1 OmpA family protein [Hyphomicrobiales bacterium]